MKKIFVILAFAVVGCKGGMKCEEGAFKSEDPAYCIKLPDGYKISNPKPQKSGESEYLSISTGPASGGMSVWFEKKDIDLDKRASTVKNMEGSDLKLVASGDVPNREGKFFHFHNEPRNYDFAVILIRGKETLYRCEIQNAAPADAKTMVESCKTFSGV